MNDMKEKVENIIEQRKHLEERLKAIAEYIDNTQPWKTVLREELGVII